MLNKKVYTSKDRETFENEFYRLLGVLIHNTARFDRYIGLQLNWMADYYGFKRGELLDPRKTCMQKRIAKLKAVSKKAFQPAGAKAMAEFSEWFAKIDKVRALRNDYVHGIWGVPGGYLGGPDTPHCDCELWLAFVPLNWNLSPETVQEETKFTLGEFADQVDDAIKLFGQYSKLSDKYLKYMRLGCDGLA